MELDVIPYFEFSNEYVGRRILLQYEPVLDNRKRPDFVMDVIAQSKVQGEQLTRRFIMDAKYYSTEVFEGLGGISNVVKNLYRIKNYSEDEKNSVFILHPAQGTIIYKVSPQSLADNSYLGELKLFDWDSDLSTVEDWTSGYPVSYPRNTPVTMRIEANFKYFFVKWQRNNAAITFDSYIIKLKIKLASNLTKINWISC
jgi:hypothetical protein